MYEEKIQDTVDFMFDNNIYGEMTMYIEFEDKESSVKAKHLNKSLFKGRQITVMPKPKNKPELRDHIFF